MASVTELNCSRSAPIPTTPIDKHIGNRIKLRRNYLKLSQDKLGRSIGLTFQQIQKYERGLNRISVSRLWDISRILNVPVSYFFEDIPLEIIQNSPCPDFPIENNISALSETANLLYKEESLKLLNAFNKIRNPQTAQIIYNLLQAIVATPKEAEYEKSEK